MNPRADEQFEFRDPSGRRVEVRVLSIGKVEELLNERNQQMRARGYKVDSARTVSDAMALLGEKHNVIIFGHAVPEGERNLIAAAAKSANQGVQIVMLYRGVIRNAELADALLTTDGGHAALLSTIEHLLNGRKRTSAEAS